MRPHSDQDQDEYHQEDDDDDDKTVIVYNETSIEQPWNFSQISGMSSNKIDLTANATTTATQREKENCEKEQHLCHDEKEEAASNVLMSRKRQHRSLGSRSRGRNTPRQPGFTSDGNGIDIDNDYDNDEVDGFASLRSMMGKLSQEQRADLSQQQQQADGESGVYMKTQCQEEMCGDKHKADHFLSQNSSDDNNIMIEPPSLLKKTTLPPLGVGDNMLQNQLVDLGDSRKAPLRKSAPPSNIRNIDSGENATENDTKDDRASANRLCSPPDFDFCTTDDHDDEDNNYEAENDGKSNKRNRTTTKSSLIPSRLRVRNQNSLLDHSGKNNDDDDDSTTGRMNRHNRHSFSNAKQYTANPKHRSEKSKKRRNLDRHDSTKRPSVSVSSSAAAAAVSTTSTRRRKRPDTISRRGFASSSTMNSEKSKRQQLSQPAQAPTNVENVKSIVGLR